MIFERDLVTEILLELEKYHLIDSVQNSSAIEYANFIWKSWQRSNNNNLATKPYWYHSHHVIPVCVAAKIVRNDPTARAAGLSYITALSSEDSLFKFTVNLSKSEHIYVHTLLAAATCVDWFRSANTIAVKLLLAVQEPDINDLFKLTTATSANKKEKKYWMHLANNTYLVPQKDVLTFLASGYILGTTRRKYIQKHCYLHRADQIKQVKTTELLNNLSQYIAAGWTFGKPDD